jgi:hypothetical protein
MHEQRSARALHHGDFAALGSACRRHQVAADAEHGERRFVGVSQVVLNLPRTALRIGRHRTVAGARFAHGIDEFASLRSFDA